MRITLYLHCWKSDCYQKVCTPVDKHGHGHGRGPRALGEELGGDHPGDGAGPHREEHDVEQRGDHGEPPDPGHQLLGIVKMYVLTS